LWLVALIGSFCCGVAHERRFFIGAMLVTGACRCSLNRKKSTIGPRDYCVPAVCQKYAAPSLIDRGDFKRALALLSFSSVVSLMTGDT